jgi:hypothetical protein
MKIDPSGFEICSPSASGRDLKSRRVYFQTLPLCKDQRRFLTTIFNYCKIQASNRPTITLRKIYRVLTGGKAPNRHGARKFVNLHGLAVSTNKFPQPYSMHACKILSFRYREWQRRGHYLRGLSQPTILLKLLLLSMCNLPTRCWNWRGREESVTQTIWFCSLRVPLPRVQIWNCNHTTLTVSGRIQDGPKLLTFLCISCSLHIH